MDSIGSLHYLPPYGLADAGPTSRAMGIICGGGTCKTLITLFVCSFFHQLHPIRSLKVVAKATPPKTEIRGHVVPPFVAGCGTFHEA
jgi:hypothetical protein